MNNVSFGTSYYIRVPETIPGGVHGAQVIESMERNGREPDDTTPVNPRVDFKSLMVNRGIFSCKINSNIREADGSEVHKKELGCIERALKNLQTKGIRGRDRVVLLNVSEALQEIERLKQLAEKGQYGDNFTLDIKV